MWPFNRKQKEADEMWRVLTDKPPKDAMSKMVDAVAKGDPGTAEKIFHQLVKENAEKYE